MSFDPSQYGGSAEEKVGAEFWKPTTEGDAIVGRIEGFKRGKIAGDDTLSMTLSPAITIGANQKKGQGYDSLRVGVNAVLGARVSEKDTGAYVAIRFDGYEKTPAGKMRLFKVWTLDAAAFRNVTAKHAPELNEDEDDDLPF